MLKLRRLLLRFLAIANKEVMHIRRDPQILGFALGMPVVMILLFGFGVSFDVEHVPLVVVDQDRSASSRALVDRFTASASFEVVASRRDPAEVETLFRAYLAKAALIVPEGYERRLRRGEQAQAQLLLDGADNTTAGIALGYAAAVSLAASRAEIERLVGPLAPSLSVRSRTFFNPALQSSVFLVPGLMVVILVMCTVMLTALTVAREYERGSMEQLFATPVGRLEVILGKLVPYFVIGLVQVLLVLALGVTLFHVPVRGSLLLLFVVASLFILAMLMQGLLISVATRSQMLASMVAAVSTFLPGMLLSGFVFPVENMPWLLRAVASVLPARYFLRALRAVLLRGNGLEVIWPDLVALALFCLVLLAAATKRFRRTVL
ncbi:MAG: ABC transporter permease [Deltaproteobacteria bacterium]|nr:ABC transporter permease [Deltaproteobacteria bacterium]